MNQVLSEANGGAPSTALFLFSIDSSFDHQSNTKTPQLTSAVPQWLDFGEKRVVSPASTQAALASNMQAPIAHIFESG